MKFWLENLKSSGTEGDSKLPAKKVIEDTFIWENK